MKRLLKNCPSCFRKKIRAKKQKIFVATMKTDAPHQKWYMDHSHIEGSTFRILCTVDHYSKRARVTVTRTENTEEVLQFLEEIFDEGELTPIETGCDNGPAFKSHVFKYYLTSKGISLRPGKPYFPEGQGVVERFHKTLKEMVNF